MLEREKKMKKYYNKEKGTYSASKVCNCFLSLFDLLRLFRSIFTIRRVLMLVLAIVVQCYNPYKLNSDK